MTVFYDKNISKIVSIISRTGAGKISLMNIPSNDPIKTVGNITVDML